MTIFGPKLWVNPFEKMQFFQSSCFYSLERRFFVLEYRNSHFPGIYSLKIILKKWPFLEENHGLTTFEKYPFIDFLNLLFL